MVTYNYQKQKKKETDLGFVMAMPAIKNLITTRCYDLASPSIMHTPSNSFTNKHYYKKKIQIEKTIHLRKIKITEEEE